MRRTQLSINTVSLRGEIPDVVAGCAEAGFSNIEFALGAVRQWFARDGSLTALRRLLQQHRLQCVGGFETHIEAFSPPPSRENNHARIIENARLISDLGGSVLVVGTDGPPASDHVEDPLQTLAAALRSVAEQIQPMGVTLAVEFNWSPLVKSFRTAVDAAERSGVPNVGVLFDPAHYHCTPSKLEQLTPEAARLVRHVHVDDMIDKPGELCNCNSDRVLPGEGCLNLREIFGRIEAGGYTGFFSIEMFSERLWSLAPRDAARRMYESLLPLCES